MDAIELLKQQHETVTHALEQMIEREDEIDLEELRLLADELVAHMVIEEHVFYPRVRQLMTDLIKEAFEEHIVARFALARAMTAKGEEQKTRLRVLKDIIEHHVEEEEEELFPNVRKRIAAEELGRLGERMADLFERAVDKGLEAFVVSGVPQVTSLGGGVHKARPVIGVRGAIRRQTKASIPSKRTSTGRRSLGR
jgi:hemerythrin superfamily protein